GQEREPGSQRGGRSQRARASPRSAGRRGACLRRAGSWRRTQGWALRAGGGLWKQGSRCPRTSGTAAATRISDQNKRLEEVQYNACFSCSPHIIIAAALLWMIEAACKLAESSLIWTISKIREQYSDKTALIGKHMGESVHIRYTELPFFLALLRHIRSTELPFFL
ncbi:hypothetical protein U0070_002579, partial [Myodes glareolus]